MYAFGRIVTCTTPNRGWRVSFIFLLCVFPLSQVMLAFSDFSFAQFDDAAQLELRTRWLRQQPPPPPPPAAEIPILPVSNGTGRALAILLSNHTGDVDHVLNAIRTFDEFIPNERNISLLLFNEGNLSDEQKMRIMTAAGFRREISFPVVDFEDYPPGFDPEKETGNWRRRSKWGYQQMCRFWVTKIWEHEIVNKYATLMRMDSDSCLTQTIVNDSAPGLDSDNTVYRAAFDVKGPLVDGHGVTQGLFDVAQKHIRNNNIVPKNADLWKLAEFWSKQKRLPIFYNNFEIDRVSFFQRHDVRKFHHAISEATPFGIFRYRWGDAAVRFLTIAIFSSPDELDTRDLPGYKHGTGLCNLGPGPEGEGPIVVTK